MSTLLCSTLSALSILIITTTISGCISEKNSIQEVIPDYIGMKCDRLELSRIVIPKEMYAVCLDDLWLLISADQFSTHKIILETPLKRPDLIMAKPANIGGIEACIKVTEYEVGWADVDYEGDILRLPLIDGSCSLSPCNQSPKGYQASICQ